ncbi:MAG TPA: serine kinase [Paraprevotella xylaniphila]|jgi:phosphoglycolate phosphatase|nr:serine kinase [Paraprevotella xylaniphila]
MKRYTIYIFDFDYTLVDSSRGIVTCFRHVLGNHGHTGVTDTEIKRTIGKTLEESFSILTGITEAGTLADYKSEYVKAADVHMTANTFFFPETIEVLETLKSQGAVLGIVSTKFRYRILDLFEKTGHDGLVDFIVGGEDVTAAKPDPEGLLLAIGRASGGGKSEVLYVGDSVVDAATAQAAGTDFSGVLHGMTTREELKTYPHVAIVDDLRGILPIPV